MVRSDDFLFSDNSDNSLCHEYSIVFNFPYKLESDTQYYKCPFDHSFFFTTVQPLRLYPRGFLPNRNPAS